MGRANAWQGRRALASEHPPISDAAAWTVIDLQRWEPPGRYRSLARAISPPVPALARARESRRERDHRRSTPDARCICTPHQTRGAREGYVGVWGCRSIMVCAHNARSDLAGELTGEPVDLLRLRAAPGHRLALDSRNARMSITIDYAVLDPDSPRPACSRPLNWPGSRRRRRPREAPCSCGPSWGCRDHDVGDGEAPPG